MNSGLRSGRTVQGEILDLMQHRLERALRERARYRYVLPVVLPEGDGYRIQSPCCSRTVEPSGGLIDIALLLPQGQHRWSLHARDHVNQVWLERYAGQPLEHLLELLCLDSERQFWP